jgi:hypothetical protein
MVTAALKVLDGAGVKVVRHLTGSYVIVARRWLDARSA